ncbi:hypothetical protein K1719_016534 [Acacia pycnantha]|nr:hypothetical protein K1719_016534 [Acacia pycnantha]
MFADSKSKSDISFAGTFASSAFSACFAEGVHFSASKFLYSSIMCAIIHVEDNSLPILLSGAVAIMVANPTDLVKVRLQAEGNYSRIVECDHVSHLRTG